MPRPTDEDEELQEGESKSLRERFEALVELAQSWVAPRRMMTLIVSIVLLVLGVVIAIGVIWQIRNIRNRPTLEDAVISLDYGAFAQARSRAEVVLMYAGTNDNTTRGGALYVMGVASCLLTDLYDFEDKRSNYLAAVNYLQQSRELGFYSGRQAEGYFYLGKSLFMAGDMDRCREPLLMALEYNADDQKSSMWYLANAYFYATQPDYDEALRYVSLFRQWPSTTREEAFEGDLLESLILLEKGDIISSENIFATVPDMEKMAVVQRYITARMAMLKAHRLAEQANALERLPDPTEYFLQLERQNREENLTGHRSLETVPQLMPSSDLSQPIDAEPSQPSTEPIQIEEQETPSPQLPNLPLPRNSRSSSDIATPAIQGVAWYETGEKQPETVRRLNWYQRRSLETDQLHSRDAAARVSAVQSQTSDAKNRLSAVQPQPLYAQEAVPEGTADEIEIVPGEPAKNPEPKSEPKPKPPKSATPEDDKINEKITQLRADALAGFIEAIDLFHEAIENDMPPYRWSRQSDLLIGVCYEELSTLRQGEDLAMAKRLYEGVTTGYPTSSEAVAAEFLLAEIQRRQGYLDVAMTGYRAAFDRLKRNPAYSNNHLTKTMMCDRASTVFEEWIRTERFERAFQLLDMLRPVMPPQTTYRMGAVSLNHWGNVLRQRAERVFFEERKDLMSQAEQKYKLAGHWFAELARCRFTESDYAECLWNSAENYRAGHDYRKSVLMFQRYLAMNFDQRRSEAYFLMGEMYYELDYLDDALRVLKRCIEDYPRSRYVPWSRLLLSKVYREKKEWDDAIAMLNQNLSGEFTPNSNIFRDSEFALGNLYFHRGNYEQAAMALEYATQQHPNAPQSAEANYLISRSYIELAVAADKLAAAAQLARVKAVEAERAMAARMSALEHYRQCEANLRQRQDSISLTDSEALMLRNAIFGIGAESMNVKRYEDAITAYELAAAEYQETPGALFALSQAALSYQALGDDAAALSVINRAKILYEILKKTNAFANESKFTPEQWQQILESFETMAKRRNSNPTL
ncbi:MAG: tetratricopeptide repeat protein [Planctomycetaceae bacterium]|jgi:tetratricopeptide (TPR) repeat protein|nr:tetratricopeptide repeat protein [Planctomycetaceae bacterium]